MTRPSLTYCRGLGRYPRWLAVAVLCTFSLQRAAADEAEPVISAERTAQTAEEEKPANCVWGCERWGKFCNVDPRGVYKCRRVCEKFGEICE